MKVHLIAIGGSAMHNLALALARNGWIVSGSDDEIFEPSRTRLEQAGLLPAAMGWDANRIQPNLDYVIVGMHARKDNPELARALELGLKVVSYPEFMYEASRTKTRVVIGGSHGKTTITSMVLHALKYAGQDVDFLVGAQLEGFDTMVKISDRAEFMLLEGDEYTASPLDPRPKFHLYRANIALLSGIAWDHVNVFPTQEAYNLQFSKFIETMEPGGALVYCADDPVLAQLVEASTHPVKKFPYTVPAHTIKQGITYLETPEGPLPLKVFGHHNLLNMEGARWICQEMGVMDDVFYQAMATFKGAARRLQEVGRGPRGVAYKDFAHSPSKVEATVAAVAEQFPDQTLVAALELHTFSSLNPEFIQGYRGCLAKASRRLVYFNPHTVAHKKLPELTVDMVREAFGDADLVVSTQSPEVVQWLKEQGTGVFLLMSSGNFDGLNLDALGAELCA
jgi:UDP-N-acetylmuramate: L-alanyl-gamma-D-glutamyl-meso-diaminopimelate ligase